MKISAIVFAALLSLSASTSWADEVVREGIDSTPSAEGMAADLVLVRPIGTVALVAGFGIFIVQLPFDLIGWQSPGEPWRKLVVEPYRYTFARRMGSSEYTY